MLVASAPQILSSHRGLRASPPVSSTTVRVGKSKNQFPMKYSVVSLSLYVALSSLAREAQNVGMGMAAMAGNGTSSNQIVKWPAPRPRSGERVFYLPFQSLTFQPVHRPRGCRSQGLAVQYDGLPGPGHLLLLCVGAPQLLLHCSAKLHGRGKTGRDYPRREL